MPVRCVHSSPLCTLQSAVYTPVRCVHSSPLCTLQSAVYTPVRCVHFPVRCVHWSRKVLLPLLRYCELPRGIFHVETLNMSRLKPISLSNFITPSSDNPENYDSAQVSGLHCPPVTGWRGNPGPVRNNYDDSGFFRGRTDSAAKRKRTETQQKIDAAYDMSRDYLANNPPPPSRPSMPPLLRKLLWPRPLWLAT